MKKIMYLEIIRILACFLVLVNHTNIVILNYQNFSNMLFYSLGFSICKVGVALFFMITGALLLNKSFDYQKSIKAIWRVFVPLLFLSFLLYLKDNGITSFNFLSFFSIFLSKPYITAYWYIYSLIGLYLAMPFIQKMVKNFNGKDTVIFITLFLFVPSLINLIHDYFNLNIYNNLFSSFFPSIIAILICGDHISKLPLKKKYFISSITILFISFSSMFCSIFLPYILHNKIIYTLDYWNSFPVLLMAISLFYIIKYIFETKEFSTITEKILSLAGSTTFGIYLIHALINFKIYNFHFLQSLFKFNAIIGTIVLDIIVFIICFVIIYLLKKLPFIKKFI